LFTSRLLLRLGSVDHLAGAVYPPGMKTVTISLEDELYETASVEAAKSRKTLGEFLRDLFLSGLRRGDKAVQNGASTLTALWELADAKPVTPGSVGTLNREELYERGLSGH